MAVTQLRKEYEIILEGSEEILKIDAGGWPYVPSIENNPLVMVRVIDYLVEFPSVSRIIFNQRRNFTYSEKQTGWLQEIARFYEHLVKQKRLLSVGDINNGLRDMGGKYAEIQYLVFNLLRSDPIGAFVEARRLVREASIRLKRIQDRNQLHSEKKYLKFLTYFRDNLSRAQLIYLVKNQLAGYKIGSRTIYKELFRPIISPNFMLTRLMREIPLDGEFIDGYTVGDNSINILKTEHTIKLLYHIVPPELKVSEDEYELIDLARTVLAEHRPRDEEFLEPERMRRTFFNIGKDLLLELAQNKGLDLDYNRIKKLTKILVRYTIGFGMIEVLLEDPRVQDITINSPIGQTPIFIVHADHGECVTNIIPTVEDSEGWATKLRLLSARPLDEANPVLDTELEIPGVRARVAAITNPLNPFGLAFALRRHREKPWTLPLFMQNKMISPLGAGLLSFFIDGAASILVAGTRSSGKTSLLGGFLVEIMRRYRIVSLEDTLELPTKALRDLGYNIQSMKVRSALTTGGTEIGADEGIRTSLRMGDSSLIVGEIRSAEAKALFEAMRIGALANVVAGTIHGDSPYGVFDRIVNDLGVPKTSFKATDIIVITNPVRSADGLKSFRRVQCITEVRKHWVDDPLREGGFVDLMKYNPQTDTLEPTDALINGESEIIKRIAGNIPEWSGDWDGIWENILLRTKMKETLVEYANRELNFDILEAGFTVQSNDIFHQISEKVKEETGVLDNKKIFFEWEEWLKRELRKRKFK